jgi:hypothetical protein
MSVGGCGFPAERPHDADLEGQPEPGLAGYEVVWRESTDPPWTHTIPVGNVTSHTVRDLSKDNVQVGVRAVDRDGFRRWRSRYRSPRSPRAKLSPTAT